VAACVAIGIGILSLSPARIDGLIQSSSDAWTSIRTSVASLRSSTAGNQDSAPVSSPLSVQAAELPAAGAVQTSLMSDDAGIETVIVQPGENLRQIALRITGKYTGDTINEIRKLNPEIGDPDDLQAGQTIRFPSLSLPEDSRAASTGVGTTGKNQNIRDRE
jgi:nucleoid-associated protein YgaU